MLCIAEHRPHALNCDKDFQGDNELRFFPTMHEDKFLSIADILSLSISGEFSSPNELKDFKRNEI